MSFKRLFFTELGLKSIKTGTMNVTPERSLHLNRKSEEEGIDFKTAIQKARYDNSVNPINSYLQSVSCGPQLVNSSVIKELRLFLQTNCHLNEYVTRTKCALLFLEYIKTVSCESEKWDAVARELVTLCTLCFLNCLLANKKGEESKEELLINIVHAVNDLMNVSPQVSVGIAQVFSSVLLKAFIEENLSFTIRRTFLSTLARMVPMSTMHARNIFVRSHKPLLRKLSDMMVTCGDYELQSTSLAIILQLLVAAGQENNISQSLFPSYPAIRDVFVLHSFENFRSELRQFLNKVNSLSENKLVYSVPCTATFLDNKELKKPDEYTEFWVDFCISTKCLYINYQSQTKPYNLIRISEQDVTEIAASECSYIVNSKPVQCIRLDVYINNNKLVKIYFPKTQLFSCLQNDVLIPLFGKKYQDGSTVDTDNTPFTKMNVNVQNDSPDEIESPPQQTQSNKKDKSKLMKSIYKNHNKSTRTPATSNNNKRSRILETENTNILIDPGKSLIRSRKSNFSEDNSCVNKKDNSNNKSDYNNNNDSNEEAKKDNRSNDFLNIMPAITKKRVSNKVSVNGKLSPVKTSVHSKETQSGKAESNGMTPRNSLEKRKLYSFQNEDYMFSSVEEYSASLPNCYKVNREKKNDVHSKVTYSYRANRSVENKVQQQDMIFSDVLESKYRLHSLTGTPKHFPVRMDVPKNNKLKKQQMPMEMDDDSTDEFKFFKSNKFAVWKQTPTKKSKKSENTKSVYSDLSSSETGTVHVQVPLNTYSRKPNTWKKRTKSKNRKILNVDSDTDSDYKPRVNTKPVQRCTRQSHRQNSVAALVNRELDDDRLRECNEAECSEELPLSGYMNISNETVTTKDIQSAPMPLLPEIATNAEYNFQNDETILLNFSPAQKSKNNFVRQKISLQEKSQVCDEGPVLRRRKYIQVKNKNISKKKNAETPEESTALARPHRVTRTNSQKDTRINNIEVNNIEVQNEKNSSGSSQRKTASPKKTPGIIDRNATTSQEDTRVSNVEVGSEKNSSGSSQHKNVSPKKKSGAIDRNTLFDDLTVYCDQNQLPESNKCSQDDADVHETSDNNELDNSQSSVRTSYRIKDLTHKDDLCRFGTALTKHMKNKLIDIQDEFKTERKVRYSELNSVLVRELKSVQKQKQSILSVAKEMETCRKILEEAFSVQMKTCEELEKSIGNISNGKKLFFKEAKKTEVNQSSRIMENINVFKEKMRGFVNTFVADDKKLMDKYRSQL